MTNKVDILKSMVSEINSYNGALEHLMAFDMEELEDILDGTDLIRFAQMIHFGDFNPNHDLFRFDGYGNLESLSEYDWEDELLEEEENILELAEEQGLDDLLEEYKEE